MSLCRTRAAFVPAYVCLAAILGSTALAMTKPSVLPPAPGDQALFAYTSRTVTPRGETRQEGSFSIARGEGKTFEIHMTPSDGLAVTDRATLQKDGTVVVDQADERDQGPFVLQRLNQIAAALFAAPDTLKPSDSWKTKISVPLPHGASAAVPVTVKVVALSEDGLDLDAAGEGGATLAPAGPGSSNTFQPGSPGAGAAPAEHPTPGEGIALKLALHATAHFSAGKLERAEGTMRSTVQLQAPFEVVSEWTLAAAKSEAR